jgi:flagellar biosynthesis protein FliR
MPQLNILSIGFPIKVMMGLLAILFGLIAVHAAIGDHVAQAGRAILRWSGALGSG